MAIEIETRGRRHYIVGDTYPIKSALREAGCKWDPDARAWWTGKREVAEEVLSKVASGEVQPTASYRKLSDGSWGVLVPGEAKAGDLVTVVTKAGDRKTETIIEVVEVTDMGTLCRVPARKQSARRGGGYRRRRYNDDDDDACDLCGKNKYTCGHCIGW